jgi:xanthine dehydrogenase accessory factor
MTTRQQAQHWLQSEKPALIIEVLEANGSTPREPGTRMLVSPDATTGTIGGGHLEWQAIRTARTALRTGTLPQDQRIALGPTLGQCCGGALTLRYTPLDDEALAAWPQQQPLFHLQLHGAGHVGRAIVQLLHALPCSVSWIDERDDEFPRDASPPHIERLCIDAPEAEVAEAPPGSFFLVLTHQHDLDLRIVQAVLQRNDFGFLGLIGSATKKARFEHRLRDRGISEQALARMTCPIGVPGIAGKAPEVVAIAVVAQLLQQSTR